MQTSEFNFWAILVGILSFFGGCDQAFTNSNSQVVKLNMPKTEGEIQYSNSPNKLALILLKDQKVYAYEGLDIGNGKIYGESAIRNVIRAAKQKFSPSKFVVVIKPSKEAAYKATVDILDEMTINNIERYSIEDLLPEEKQKLKIENQKE